MNVIQPDLFTFWQEWVSAMMFELEQVPTRQDLFPLLRQRYERSVGSDTTLTLSDYQVRVDVSSGNVSVTLPETNARIKGYEWIVTLVSPPSNSLIVLPAGSDDIVGESSVVYDEQWTSLVFRARSNGWDIT